MLQALYMAAMSVNTCKEFVSILHPQTSSVCIPYHYRVWQEASVTAVIQCAHVCLSWLVSVHAHRCGCFTGHLSVSRSVNPSWVGRSPWAFTPALRHVSGSPSFCASHLLNDILTQRSSAHYLFPRQFCHSLRQGLAFKSLYPGHTDI